MEGHCEVQSQAQRLPPALQLHILSFLPSNDRALSGRLVSPDAAATLAGPDHCTASLSQPLPPHAAPWAVEPTRQRLRQLPFQHKLRLLCTAAASGSAVNLEVVLPLLQPSIFLELWYNELLFTVWDNDPGVAAVEAGHPQLLGTLLHRCPGLLNPEGVISAAAKHCDLAGLQAAWELLRAYPESVRPISGWRTPTPSSLAPAAQSVTPDAVAKMEWVLNEGALGPRVAAAAARTGDLGRLRWLRDRGCSVGGRQVLECALRHADLAVVQWLVDEAGCKLPPAGGNQEWQLLLSVPVSAQDAVAKLQWLGERGALPLHEVEGDLAEVAYAAVGDGRVDVLQHLRSLPGLTPQQDREILRGAFSRQRKVDSIPVLEYLRRVGVELTPAAYPKAAGSLDVVRWLACEGSCRPASHTLEDVVKVWPRATHTQSRDLREAVQLLVGEAGCTDWGVQQRPKERVVCSAARRGDLALVQYLLQQLPGYQPGWKVLAAAAEGGGEALLEWLVEQHPGCLAGPWDRPAYICPALSGQRGTLTALRRLGVPWGGEDVVVQAVRWGCPVLVLRWLVEQGAPVGRAGAMEAAMAESRHLSVEEGEWLRGLAAAANGT